MPANELVMTHELIAAMLGVRREGITEAAGNLQRAGLISYRRRRNSILNRPGLESHACECYHVVRKEFHRLFSDMRNHQKRAQACYGQIFLGDELNGQAGSGRAIPQRKVSCR